MIGDDVIPIEVRLAAGTLVPAVDALFYALVAEAVATLRHGRAAQRGHAYGALEVLVDGGNLEEGARGTLLRPSVSGLRGF